MRDTAPGNASRARVVFLGASNLTRGISIAVETSRLRLGAPLEILMAGGHGRSYGMRSSVLGRALPGIVECGIWDALARAGAPPTFALVTDIGNDVMYGAQPDTIATWVGQCLERLAGAGATVAMTRLPLARIESIRPWEYAIVRRLFFPGRQLSLSQALSNARKLDGHIRALGEAHGVGVVEPRLEWYGLDPIHITHRHLGVAWSAMLAPWSGDMGAGRARGSLRRWLRLRTTPAERWWLFGFALGRPQPARRLPDRSTLALY